MRYVRMLGLCLVAAFVLGVFMAANASAKLPERGRCNLVGTGGRYVDTGCTVKAPKKGHGEEAVYEGAYEWTPKESGFSGNIINGEGTSVTFETQAGVKIQCAKMSYESEFLGSVPSTPFWQLEECASEGKPCSTLSIGSFVGEISNALAFFEEEGHGWESRLGFIEGKGSPEPVVGLEYTANNKETGQPELITGTGAPIECEGAAGTVWIGGERHGGNSFIAKIDPVNQMTREVTLTFASSAPGIQTPERFAHNKPVHLQAFLHNHWEPVAVNATMKFEINNFEIKATR